MTMVELVLVGPDSVTRREHRLGGAGSVRLARATKTAIDLVRGAAGAPSAAEDKSRGAAR